MLAGGLTASMTGVLAELTILAATLPQWCDCSARSRCVILDCDWGPIYRPIFQWRPFLDNPGSGPGRPDAGPHCPRAPDSPAGFALADAPLPAEFDPAGFPGARLFVCVKVTASGDVAAAQLVAGTGDPAMDRRIVDIVRDTWRLERAAPGAASATWLRVRINSDAAARRSAAPL